MKKKKERKYTKEELAIIKSKNKGINSFTGVIVGMFVCVTAYLIFNILRLANIENLLRYIFIVILGILSIVVIFKYLKLRKQPKRSKYLVFIILLLILGIGEFMISSIIDRGISTIDKISKDRITYTSSLVAMKDGKFTTKKSITKANIGIIADHEDTEGYVLAQTIIKNDKIKKKQLTEYDDYISMLRDLYDGEINMAFVSGSYVDKFSTMEKFENIKDEVVEVDKYSKLMKKVVNKSTKASTKSVTEPFTLLLLGVDSETEDISKTSGLGDSIMLITFNPNTLNATIFSIPRDTYVPISCFGNYKNKITHAASGGDSCMINTVENFTGIDIDYYAKVNFRGLTKLVDSLGGIDVDVPYSFCESNSLRSLDYRDLIYVNKGWQHLNGEQALALSRNRKTVDQCGKEWNQGTRNDFVRGQNQQLVIKAIMQKAKSIKSINKVYDILDEVSISLDTNLSRNQILDFYNVFKKIILSSDSLTDDNDVISMQKTYLNGSSAMIYDKRSGLVLYNYVPSSSSLKAIVNAMKINLELKEEEYDKSFSFSIDEEYEPEVIGEKASGGSSVGLLPNFIGKTKAYVSSWCNARGISVNFVYEDVTSGYSQDEVINQSLPESYSLDELSGSLQITLANVKSNDDSNTDNKKNDSSKKDDDDDDEDEITCEDENKELGEDKKTCVCKPGFNKKPDGTCEKKKLDCSENEEPSADNSTCFCKPGFSDDGNGNCIPTVTGLPTE